jgi:hypothetical protein
MKLSTLFASAVFPATFAAPSPFEKENGNPGRTKGEDRISCYNLREEGTVVPFTTL